MAEHLQLSTAKYSPALSGVSNDIPSPSAKPHTAVPSALSEGALPKEGLELYLESIEKQLIMLALYQCHWNRTAAAKKLGLSFRALRYKLKKLGLDDDADTDE